MRFCDIQNNQGRDRGYQPKPRLRLITLSETLIILNITKTESNNCFTLKKKQKSHVCASSLTAIKTKGANLT